MEIPIERIKCDIRGRTNQDVTELYRSLMEFGQHDPILVEGPDEEGYYYLIHGYRRFLALSKNKNKFKKVKCSYYGCITSKETRNAVRLLLISNGKKATGLDEQLVYEELTDFEGLERLLPKHKKSRMKKGKDVPQDIRIKYEKKRRSQDALALLYGLDGLGSYKTKLLELLLDGEITTIHSDAIKRVVKHPLFENLEQSQKIKVIEKARKTAKFTDNKAAFIIFEEIMRKTPKRGSLQNWTEYISDEIERISGLIHNDLEEMLTDIQRIKLKNSLIRLNEQLDWIYEEDSHNKRGNFQIPSSGKMKISNFKDKEKETGFNKELIIMEKKDGNKFTFFFN